ncbi:MAG TPA: hypothetical protein DCS66_24375 [Flavobacteriaceae bacterium]|nr:hypothetical protein [Flavobacteriaceae bacterium]
MKDYKQLLQAISKRVKTVDKVLAASRKHMNEYVGIALYAIPDKGGIFFGRSPLIKVTEQWHRPQVTYCYETNSTITRPDYYWEEATLDKYESWKLDFYKTDMKDGNHRPLFILHVLGETEANLTYIYTKKEFDRAQGSYHKFPIALKQFQLGTKRVDGGKYRGKIDVPRILGDEIDTMKDDDVMFITAEGWDQEAIFEIKHFTTREMGVTERNSWDSNEDCAEDIINMLIELDASNSPLTRRY